MAHSVPLKMAPTLAKFFPDDTDERYMSRRPCFSCCFSGRSVSGMLPAGVATVCPASVGWCAVAAADTVEDGAGAVGVGVDLAALVAAAVVDCAEVVEVVAVVGCGVGTGRGWDIGVS